MKVFYPYANPERAWMRLRFICASGGGRWKPSPSRTRLKTLLGTVKSWVRRGLLQLRSCLKNKLLINMNVDMAFSRFLADLAGPKASPMESFSEKSMMSFSTVSEYFR
ncbi:MAG: hypothetical protein WAV07_03575 [Candidatus Contendobacter sp.]